MTISTIWPKTGTEPAVTAGNGVLMPLAQAPDHAFSGVTCVLTDVDDTLTHHSRISAATFAALERLALAGIPVVPVTAAPAAWCEAMVQLWPIAGAIAENGGIALKRDGSRTVRRFWHGDGHPEELTRLLEAGRALRARYSWSAYSEDQVFRRSSLAFESPGDVKKVEQLQLDLGEMGLSTTFNSLWVLGWRGGYDKLSAARKFLPWLAGHDTDLDRDNIFYAGDSKNDEVMFSHFPRSAGVSTLVDHIKSMTVLPTWITEGPGGAGFVEIADRILQSIRS